MIHHTVMWKLNDPADAPRFKSLLDTCQGVVPGMLQFDVGVRVDGMEANCDVVLLSAFTDASALSAYQTHPKHKAVVAELGAMRASRMVLDFAA